MYGPRETDLGKLGLGRLLVMRPGTDCSVVYEYCVYQSLRYDNIVARGIEYESRSRAALIYMYFTLHVRYLMLNNKARNNVPPPCLGKWRGTFHKVFYKYTRRWSTLVTIPPRDAPNTHSSLSLASPGIAAARRNVVAR